MASTSSGAAGYRGLQLCGSIPTDELSAVNSRWLDDAALLVAMTHQQQMAVAVNRTIVMRLSWAVISGGGGDQSPPPPMVRKVGSCLEPDEQLTAMEWVVFEAATVLAVGTSFGALLLFSQKGNLLIKQLGICLMTCSSFDQYFHSDPVLRLRVRSEPLGHMSNDTSEDLCIIYPKAIARIETRDLLLLVHRKLREREGMEGEGLLGWRVGGEGLDGEPPPNRLPFLMWNVNKAAAGLVCADGAVVGLMPPPLLEQQSRRHYAALTVGPDSTLAAFRVSGDKNSSLVGVIMDNLMPATVTKIASLTKRFWQRDENSESNRPTEVSPQAFSRASLVTCLKDPVRKGERLAVAPGGSLAAVADSLGRVLLVDVHAVVVVRIWKGYRDAHCLFLEAPVDGSASYGDLNHPYLLSQKRQEFRLCLAIHAPRRGVVEVWQMRHGARLANIRVPESCCLLQPSCKLRDFLDLDSQNLDHEYEEHEMFEPAKVYILQGYSGP
ncbi:hypothetical protein BDL97_16G026700 [Sphagnum fallax]|nr:hypothetical protein BDL97_16G026700 [Sphagnum fallax]